MKSLLLTCLTHKQEREVTRYGWALRTREDPGLSAICLSTEVCFAVVDLDLIDLVNLISL